MYAQFTMALKLSHHPIYNGTETPSNNVRTVHNGTETLSHLGPQTMYAQFTMALKHYHI